MIDSIVELNNFLDARARSFSDALLKLAKSRLGKEDYNKALSDLAELLRSTAILSNLYGRKRTLMQADWVRQGKFSMLPVVHFEEALADLITREPRLERSSLELSRLYNTEHVFGMARSVDVELTKRVQKAINDILLKGEGLASAEEIIMEIGDWSRAYAATVYRTNVSTNYMNGRFEQVKEDPFVSEIIPAMEFVAQLDARTRPNHAAAHGMIAGINDNIWAQFKPPIGYQCRCGAEFVSVFELEEKGLIKNGKVIRYLPQTFVDASPDPGFKIGAQSWENV